MSLRHCVAALALVGTALAPWADAGPRCRSLLVDVPGDAQYGDADPVLREAESKQGLDLLSADLQSDRTSLTVLVRVTGADPERQPRRLDRAWEVSFSTLAGGRTHRFAAFAQRHQVGGDRFTLFERTGTEQVPEDTDDASAYADEAIPTTVTGSIDEKRGIIRMRIPVSAFTATGGLGAHLTNPRSLSFFGHGASAADQGVTGYLNGDLGRSDRTYRVGTRGCV